MMRDLSFRKANHEDVPQIVALVNSAYRGEASKLGWTTEADLLGGQRTDAREISSLVEARGSMMLLCLLEAETIGCVHLEKVEDGANLGMFTVKPVLQGKGIGKRFLQAAEAAAREAWGIEKITMAVITYRRELIAFYERRGYIRTGIRKEFPTDPRFGIPKVDDLHFELLEKSLK